MADLKPRKTPRQQRSRANVDALLDATAHLLREDGYAALTTNHIAERAGVCIGTLYQFFPGKEAVVAALAERQIRDHFAAVQRELTATLAEATPEAAFELLVRRIARMLSADRRLHAVLLREVPFLKETALVREAVDALVRATRTQMAPLVGGRARSDADAEGWLMGRIAYEALVAIAVFRESPASVDRSVDAFIRLLLRMLDGDRAELRRR
jgi:AcrR family transcriptional regulator